MGSDISLGSGLVGGEGQLSHRCLFTTMLGRSILSCTGTEYDGTAKKWTRNDLPPSANTEMFR